MTNRVVVVSGGSKGIGYAISKTLLERDYTVISLARSARKPFVNSKFYEVKLDLLDDTAASTYSSFLIENGITKIDALVNNAGVTSDALLDKMAESDWDYVMNSNVRSFFTLTQASLPFLRNSDSACVVNISSIIGKVGNIGQSNYAASKGAILALTKCWAKEFNRKEHKIRVNSVSPGFISTEMLDSVPEKFIQKVVERTPLSRLGSPSEISQVVAFLLSDESSFINGSDISVDGGLVW